MTRNEFSSRSVLRGLIFTLVVLASGTSWFTLRENYSFVDGLYMTVITISTVGFQEIHELDGSGRVFVIFLIVGGLAVLTYTLGSVGRVIIEGSLQRYVGRRRMMNDIDNLSGHYIVCGYGRMGRILCEALTREKAPFVVIDGDAETVEKLEELGYNVVEGNATEDDVLVQAGIRRAKGLVAVVSSNVDNLYITLSARGICQDHNSDLFILSRATDESASEKIRRAGADQVISPYYIGGMRIVQALLRPTVFEFVDRAMLQSGLDLRFDELDLGPQSPLHGVALMDSNIRRDFDVIVIVIKKPSGEMIFNPGPKIELENHDVLVALGKPGQLTSLRQAFA